MKSIFKSKTIWLNAIFFVLMVLALPQFNSIIPEAAVPYISLVTAILNGVLRLFFNTPPLTETAANATTDS